MESLILVLCDFCKKQFYKLPIQIKRTSHNFCSRKCSQDGRKIPCIFSCTLCGKIFNLKHSELAKTSIHFCSKNCFRKWLSIQKQGIGNPKWVGDAVKKQPIHGWVKRKLTKPDFCLNCKTKTSKLDLANISQEYKRDLKDWKYLCRRCHMLEDGRMNNLKQYHLMP